MTIRLTMFHSIKDNRTHKNASFQDWDAFADALEKMSQRPLDKKEDAFLISPAMYKPRTTRANRNVTEWAGWAALDVDDYEVNSNDVATDIISKYNEYSFICYSTASSTDEHPKFRLVFEIEGQVPVEKIRPFWFALNAEIGSLGDKQVKDYSRMYYIPAQYAGANNFYFRNSGSPIIVDDLIGRHPLPLKETRKGKGFFERLPPAMQEMIIQHRKDQQENSKVSWTSYIDCPFVNQRMILEYQSITETGWYHKMYQLMVSIAALAIKNNYPITSREIASLCRQIDQATGSWYDNRPLDLEAERAIEYVYRHNF